MSNLEDDDNVELSLGLSLNGQFGSDPERGKKKIIRASSISNFTMMSSSDAGVYVPIARTCSLPVETEEEWRNRRELQSMRRMEAKRKRLEKLKNVRNVREKVSLEEDNDTSTNCVEENGHLGEKKVCLAAGLQVQPPLQPSLQGSVGSQGSGSSGISDFDSKPIRGMRSPASVQSLPQQVEQKPVTTPEPTNNRAAKPVGAAMDAQVTTVAHKGATESTKNRMVDMPWVYTMGNGPNGKRIEGFLYRYRKGEEVRIVCVCHGSFLTPAEFIKHAGGDDVAHPLRHIVVKRSTFL